MTTAAKAPSFPFYPSDWVRDMQAHPLEIQGAWMRLLCQIWWEPDKEIHVTVDEAARLLGMPHGDAETTLATILRCKIASGRQQDDGSYRIWCRRWKRQLDERVAARIRDRKYKERRKNDTNATSEIPAPSSPSSLSLSSSRLSPMPPDGDSEEFLAAWNNSGLSRARKMTVGRLKHFCVRMKDSDWRDNWENALAKLKINEWAKGRNERGWIATIDFFLKPDTVTKILEGSYDSLGESAAQPKNVAPIVNRTAAQYEDLPDWAENRTV